MHYNTVINILLIYKTFKFKPVETVSCFLFVHYVILLIKSPVSFWKPHKKKKNPSWSGVINQFLAKYIYNSIIAVYYG